MINFNLSIRTLWLAIATGALCPSPVSAATGDPVLLNEILASHTGTDDTEFLELYGIPGTSLDGLSLIIVEGDAFAAGTIDRRIDFKPFQEIGPNGESLGEAKEAWLPGTHVFVDSLVMGAPGRVVRQLDEAARERLLWSAAHYRENAARFRAGLVAVRT